jgi:hypothetical protein
MLPDKGIDDFLSAVDDAVELAAEGCLAAGYDVLVSGRTSAMVDRAAGQPLAEELVSHYKLAIENYIASFGMKTEEEAER